MKNQQLIKVKGYDKVYDCYLAKSSYVYNKSLVLGFNIAEDDSTYGVFTKCLENGIPSDRYCAFIDINNWDDIEDIIKSNNLGEPTGRYCKSGYCYYPEYRFRKELIDLIPGIY